MGKIGTIKMDFTRKSRIQTAKETECEYYNRAKELLEWLDGQKWGGDLAQIQSTRAKLHEIPPKYVDQVVKDYPSLEDVRYADD